MGATHWSRACTPPSHSIVSFCSAPLPCHSYTLGLLHKSQAAGTNPINECPTHRPQCNASTYAAQCWQSGSVTGAAVTCGEGEALGQRPLGVGMAMVCWWVFVCGDGTTRGEHEAGRRRPKDAGDAAFGNQQERRVRTAPILWRCAGLVCVCVSPSGCRHLGWHEGCLPGTKRDGRDAVGGATCRESQKKQTSTGTGQSHEKRLHDRQQDTAVRQAPQTQNMLMLQEPAQRAPL